MISESKNIISTTVEITPPFEGVSLPKWNEVSIGFETSTGEETLVAKGDHGCEVVLSFKQRDGAHGIETVCSSFEIKADAGCPVNYQEVDTNQSEGEPNWQLSGRDVLARSFSLKGKQAENGAEVIREFTLDDKELIPSEEEIDSQEIVGHATSILFLLQEQLTKNTLSLAQQRANELISLGRSRL
jgi:hypothetical protein